MFYSKKTKKRGKTLFLLAIVIAVVTGAVAFKKLFPVKYVEIIEKYAGEYDLPVDLVFALIRAESGFDEGAKSPRDACGLMQVIKQTADWAADEIGIENYSYDRIFEPEINVQIGCWYLNRLINQYDGNVDTALAAYNAGSGNVSKWLNEQKSESGEKKLDSVPFPETENYVKKVNLYRRVYKLLLKYGLNKI